MKWSLYTIFGLILASMILIAAPVHASVTLKISASNPSSFSEKVVPVKTYLPRGIAPDNVIDSGGLDIEFDEERGQAFVYKSVTLAARDSVVFNVEIDDIWLFSNDVMAARRNTAKTLAGQLEQTKLAVKADALHTEIESYLSEIAELQENSLVFKVGPVEHISAYEINKETMALIEEGIKELEQFVIIARESEKDRKEAMREGKVGEERIHTDEVKEQVLVIEREGESGCLVEITLADEKSQIQFDAPKTSSFRIVIENPSRLESKTVPVRYFLTKEIKGRDVIETSGLKIGFDFERNLYYVYSKAVELAPAETKIFDIILKNRWTIDKRGLFASKVYIESMVRTAPNAEDGADAIVELGEKAIEECDVLLKRKEMEELSGNRLNSFRDDKEKHMMLDKMIRDIEDLLMQAGISPADSLIEQEEYCVKAKAEGLSKDEMEEGLTASTVLETQRIKTMAGTIFKGKSISGASTWKVINYIIAFLGVLSSVFYFVNIRQQKSTMFDPLTGAFSRAYVLERLHEELKIAKGAGNKCSLLVMDIDKFKGINDTYGHAVGDTILKEFVIALRKGVRATDLVGRFGGDEFVIILPTSEKAIAFKIAESIARIIESTSITVTPKLTLSITSSVGVATYPSDSGTADDLFNKADQALYEVKKRGGNGAHSYGT